MAKLVCHKITHFYSTTPMHSTQLASKHHHEKSTAYPNPCRRPAGIIDSSTVCFFYSPLISQKVSVSLLPRYRSISLLIIEINYVFTKAFDQDQVPSLFKTHVRANHSWCIQLQECSKLTGILNEMKKRNYKHGFDSLFLCVFSRKYPFLNHSIRYRTESQISFRHTILPVV